MKKRSQIKKYSVQKVHDLLSEETHPEMLKMYAEHVRDKNAVLEEEKQSLIEQINKVREKTKKISFQMNDNVKDRLEKKEKVIMDSKSRPTTEDVKNMAQLYAYMQNQTKLINRNNADLDSLEGRLDEIQKQTVFPVCDYSELDTIYENLENKCKEEQKVRDDLIEDRDKRRAFYQSINETIEEYRIKYDIVEKEIADKEKELDHLTTYFKNRQEEDEERVRAQANMTAVLQNELLKAQEIINYNSTKTMNLKIQKIEFDGKE